MRKASAGIVNVTTTPLFFYLESCELLYCFIGIIVIISSSADGGGGIHFVHSCCSCCNCNCISTSSGIMVFSRSSCCVGVAEFYSQSRLLIVY